MVIRESKNLKYDKTTKISAGGSDYDKIEKKLPSLLKHSYEEILETDLTAVFI